MGDLDKRVINAQQNSDERESIINEYIPFIKSTVNSHHITIKKSI